jgi:hypothetical protein
LVVFFKINLQNNVSKNILPSKRDCYFYYKHQSHCFSSEFDRKLALWLIFEKYGSTWVQTLLMVQTLHLCVPVFFLVIRSQREDSCLQGRQALVDFVYVMLRHVIS